MPKLLYVISEDWFFCSHFLDRAKAAQQAGYEVVVLTRLDRHRAQLAACGIRAIALRMKRSGTAPLRELDVLRQLWRVYRAERPALVHHVALKPILYGSLVASVLGLRAVVNAPVGMGYVFTAGGARGQLLRALVRTALRRLLNRPGSKVVFENAEDLAAAIASGGVRAADGVLIRGAGVDLQAFAPGEPPPGPVVVVLAARMLFDKGVAEFVEAARLLHERGVSVRCVLVGAPDPENPSSVSDGQLARWQAEGHVECWGRREDMSHVLAQSHIACLPSYREGLPKFLLEAMACGLPVVSTDVPGCRELVEPSRSGLLVPPRDAPALAVALQALAADATLRFRLGMRGRALAVERYGRERVSAETLAVYRSVCDVG